MKVTVKGSGKTKSLTQRHQVGQPGGEGTVYASGNLAYKIYHDPKKMIPEGKFNELSSLDDPRILRPKDVLVNRNKPVGYTMRFVKDTWTLCQLFPKAFRDREGLDNKTVMDLVQQSRDLMEHVHGKGILAVDFNEMNALVSSDFSEMYFIDVDSYQTRSYPATVLMESIRDRHMKPGKFNQGTDWFAFAVVSFQMFIGIHPFKGFHKTVKGIDSRMKKNLSVLGKDVDLPPVTMPLDSIPPAYRVWYEDVFEKGARIAPPLTAHASTIIVKVARISGSNKFEIIEIEDLSDIGKIIKVQYSYGTRAAQSKKGLRLRDKTFLDVSPTDIIGFTPTLNHAVSAKIENGKLSVRNISINKPVPTVLNANKVMTYGGRIYVRNDNGQVYQLTYVEMPTSTICSPRLVAEVMPTASKMYDGVIIQNLLEAAYVSMFPSDCKHQQIRIKELEKYRIIDAKFDRGLLQVVGQRKDSNYGVYDRLVFSFDKDYKEYDTRKVEDINHTGLNFVVLDNGVCVQIDEELRVHAFRVGKGHVNVTEVKDKAITSDMKLFRRAGSAVVAQGDKLYSFKMR